MDDEDSILPHKLQAALEHVLERRKELACDVADNPSGTFLSDLLYSGVRKITKSSISETICADLQKRPNISSVDDAEFKISIKTFHHVLFSQNKKVGNTLFKSYKYNAL